MLVLAPCVATPGRAQAPSARPVFCAPALTVFPALSRSPIAGAPRVERLSDGRVHRLPRRSGPPTAARTRTSSTWTSSRTPTRSRGWAANAEVGPPLDRYGRRVYIVGRLPNTPETLTAWLRAPQRYAPGGAMPDLDVNARDARDIAAYLYALH